MIKEDLENYIGEYESFIDVAPYIMEQLEALNVNASGEFERRILHNALNYEGDILPKAKYGPYHYVTHIIVGGITLIMLGISEIEGFNLAVCINLSVRLVDENQLKELIREIFKEE